MVTPIRLQKPSRHKLAPRAFTTVAALIAAATVLEAQSLPTQLQGVIDLAEVRYENVATNVLRGNTDRFINYTTTSGNWQTQSSSTWTSGFLPGIYWYLYGLTGDNTWELYGEDWNEGVRSRATATDNDTGFQILDSFGTALDFGTNIDRIDYIDTILLGAETMTDERYNSTIGAYRAWDQDTSNPASMPFEVNVDMIMNMELVLFAAENGGPSVYTDYAINHADRTWDDLVRVDGSTFHVVEYDSSGGVVGKRTHQGWTTNSTWSRGQAWAVYGYTMLYRYTELPRMLDRAELTFDYFVKATDAQRADGIPYSDFDAPINSNNPSDTSAAAIVASAALELYTLTSDFKYLERAELILSSLSATPYLTSGTNHQALLDYASEKWGKDDVGAVFADFYLLEAAWRYLNWVDDGSSGELWNGFPREGDYVDTGSYIGGIDVRFEPWLYAYELDTWLYFVDNNDEITNGAWFYMLR